MNETTWDLFPGRERSAAPGQPVASSPFHPLTPHSQIGKDSGQSVIDDQHFSFCQDINSRAYHPVYSERAFERLRMPRAPHWAIVWSDLMMTMFIFFAVLYIYQSDTREIVLGEGYGFDVGSEVGNGVMGSRGGGSVGPAGEATEGSMDMLYDLSRQTIMNADLEGFARVDLAVDKTIRFVLTGDLLFDSGSAEMKLQALQSLKKILPLVAQTPYMINVVGHTDNIPIHTEEFPSNWELSLLRAGKVARFLITESGLDEKRFYVTGHASFEPVVANDTAENRAANRRVEIILTREKPAVNPR